MNNYIIINYNLLLLLVFVVVVKSSFTTPVEHLCSNTSNTFDYSEIINNVLAQLESATENRMFNYTSSYNQHSDKSINGMAQCMAYASQAECSSCVKNATSAVRDMLKSAGEFCRNKTNMWAWYNNCFLKYSTQNFYGRVDYVGVYVVNRTAEMGSEDFERMLTELIADISFEAVAETAVMKFVGKGNSTVKSTGDQIYGLVQCTEDLRSVESCGWCLQQAASDFFNLCANKKGCLILLGSCFVRYEIYPF